MTILTMTSAAAAQIREHMSGPEFHNMENQFWAVGSAVVWAGLWNKRVLADYQQLLRPVLF